MNCSLPGSSVPEISQARKLEWVAISFSRGSYQPRNRTWVSREGACTENGPRKLSASWLLLIPRFLPPRMLPPISLSKLSPRLSTQASPYHVTLSYLFQNIYHYLVFSEIVSLSLFDGDGSSMRAEVSSVLLML